MPSPLRYHRAHRHDGDHHGAHHPRGERRRNGVYATSLDSMHRIISRLIQPECPNGTVRTLHELRLPHL